MERKDLGVVEVVLLKTYATDQTGMSLPDGWLIQPINTKSGMTRERLKKTESPKELRRLSCSNRLPLFNTLYEYWQSVYDKRFMRQFLRTFSALTNKKRRIVWMTFNVVILGGCYGNEANRITLKSKHPFLPFTSKWVEFMIHQTSYLFAQPHRQDMK